MDPQEKGEFDKDIERKIFCKNYSECLQFVAEIGWQNFTCKGPCKSYDPEHHGGAYWLEDAENCLNMLRAAGYQPGM